MTVGELVRHNRTAILGVTALVVGAGLWAAGRMPVAIFPEVGFHRISVIARAGDMPVEQTLTALTRPLENGLTSVLGVQTIRSMTTRGGSQFDLVFGWDNDMLPALQLVRAAMEDTRSALPPGTELDARLLDTSAFPIVGIAVTAPQRSLAQMSDFVLYEAAPRLRTLPGVYRVELNGAKMREYALTIDPTALVQHHLAIADVEAAVRNASLIAAGGQVRDGYQLTLTVVRGAGSGPSALPDVVVAEDHGIAVRLADVARVEATVREDFTRAGADGAPAVLIGVSRQPSGNAVTISDAVHEQLTLLAREHPEYRFSVVYDQADLVHDAIASVRDSIAVGLVLAIATIFFFIAHLRTTVVAAAVIPATLLITCVVMHALGMSFNLMTLGGLAAGIGLVIDDAIVVVENFHRHRVLGEPADTALQGSVSEITHALVGSTLTPVMVLLPLALLSGVAGAFFRPLALAMSMALLVSLALALSFTPALAAALEGHDTGRTTEGPGDRIAARLAHWYRTALQWTLPRAWVATVLVAVFIAVAIVAYSRIETGFVPEMDEGAFILDYWSPPGTSLEQTVRMLQDVDDVLQHTAEVSSFARRTGAELGFFLTETNRGDYTVRLRRGKRRPIGSIFTDVREAVHARQPGLRVEFVQILQDMIGDLSGNPNPVEVKLFGNDQPVLQQAARAATAAITRLPGIVDPFDGITEVGPTYRVDVDEQRAHLVGLDAAAIQHWLETATTGTVAGQVLDADRAIPLRLRYPDEFRNRLETLRTLTLVTPQGRLAPLSSIAQLMAGPPAVQRTRENLRQLVRVTARISDADLGSVMRAVRQTLSGGITLPAGVSVEYGGLYASQQQAFGELLLVFAASVASVGALLLVEFGSIAAVLAIIAGSSLALSGSLASLWLTGTALNVSSIVGMIMVVGIVAKNGILLLDFAGRECARTGDLVAAVINAGEVRLRPILMTSLAAMAGLAPLALGLGAGGEMQQPLAIAILGGLAFSMLFSLILVPFLYVRLARPATRRITLPDAPAGR